MTEFFFFTTVNAMHSLCPSPGPEIKAAWVSRGLPPPPATHPQAQPPFPPSMKNKDSSSYIFIYFFIQPILTTYLLCARSQARHFGNKDEFVHSLNAYWPPFGYQPLCQILGT